MIFLNNFKFLLPEIFLSSLILFLLVFGVFLNKIQYQKRYFSGLQNVLVLILFGLFILFFLVFFQYNCDFFILNFHYVGDRLNHFIKSLLVLFTIFIFILSNDFSKYEKEFHFEYYILILLALLGLLLLVSANDFIFLYLALELQSLSLYVLATSNRYLNKSIEGGLKYFIFGSLASGLFLFGVSLLYGLTGLTNFSELSVFLHLGFIDETFSLDYILLLFLSFFFIIIGFLFKFSIVPFHS
jgi:NADH-quinone oxidoreductase subunit N